MSIPVLGPAQITLIVASAVIVVAGIAGLLILRARRTKRLRTRFGGAEYSRALAEVGSRRKGEAELEERVDRVDALHIRPLSPDDRARFSELWRRIQGRFIDAPGRAVGEANRLLRELMSTRGYSVTGLEQRAADVSVGHPRVINDYRRAQEIVFRQARGDASIEELRQAMFHYGALFKALTYMADLGF